MRFIPPFSGRGSRRSHSETRIVALLLAAALALALVTTTSGAAYVGTTANSSSLATGTWCNASRPAIKSIQKGTVSSTTVGTTSVAVTAVDTTKAFLMFTTRMNSGDPDDALLRGRLASATSIEFIRGGTGSPAIVADWTLVEYGCGVKVQRGDLNQSSCNLNVTITAVSSVARSFVLWGRSVSSSTHFGDDDVIIAQLTSTTNLRLWCEYPSGLSGKMLSWQVVEFTDPAAANVQAGILTGGTGFGSAIASRTVTLPTAVDLTRTFVLVTASNPFDSTDADLGRIIVTGRLTNSTTLVLERAATGAALAEVFYQVIELKDGSLVQSGTLTVAAGAGSNTAALTTIDPARSTGLLSGQYANGVGFATNTDVANDNPGYASFTAAVTANQLTLTRNNTTGTAVASWFVIRWGD